MINNRPILLLIIIMMISSTVYSQQNSESIFKKNPYLLFNKNNTTMRIIWQLGSHNKAIVRLYTKDNVKLLTDTILENTDDHIFIYDFINLSLSTEYRYKITSGSETKIGSFHSRISDTTTNFSFIAYGDTRTYPQDHDKLCKQILQHIDTEPNLQTFIISTGDLVSNGDKEEIWQEQFFDTKYTNINKILASLPYMTSMGNHEGQGTLFAKYFPYDLAQDNRFYYSFEYGTALFIAIDQFTSIKPGSKQYLWFENTLKTANNKWKIVLLHKPGFTAGGHKNNKIVQKILQPLFQKYNVNLVLAGHNHYYARAVVDGITHITTGGGGAPLYKPKQKDGIVIMDKSHHFIIINIDNDIINLKAIRSDGSIIETTKIKQL